MFVSVPAMPSVGTSQIEKDAGDLVKYTFGQLILANPDLSGAFGEHINFADSTKHLHQQANISPEHKQYLDIFNRNILPKLEALDAEFHTSFAKHESRYNGCIVTSGPDDVPFAGYFYLNVDHEDYTFVAAFIAVQSKQTPFALFKIVGRLPVTDVPGH